MEERVCVIKLSDKPTEGVRDAVHVAIIGQVATEHLRAGQRLKHGIVNPFGPEVVCRGESYWLFLYPETVTDMVHVWSHPAFPVGTTAESKKEVARKWLESQCGPLGISFDALVSEHCEIVNREWIITSLNESARDHWWSIEKEFWEHYRDFTGRDVPLEERGGFTCTC